jgi:ubiquinol-cytochrome c reductase cytochrome c1 subunit
VHASHLSDEGLHPPAYPWSHKGVLDTFDHARYEEHLAHTRPI